MPPFWVRLGFHLLLLALLFPTGLFSPLSNLTTWSHSDHFLPSEVECLQTHPLYPTALFLSGRRDDEPNGFVQRVDGHDANVLKNTTWHLQPHFAFSSFRFWLSADSAWLISPALDFRASQEGWFEIRRHDLETGNELDVNQLNVVSLFQLQHDSTGQQIELQWIMTSNWWLLLYKEEERLLVGSIPQKTQQWEEWQAQVEFHWLHAWELHPSVFSLEQNLLGIGLDAEHHVAAQIVYYPNTPNTQVFLRHAPWPKQPYIWMESPPSQLHRLSFLSPNEQGERVLQVSNPTWRPHTRLLFWLHVPSSRKTVAVTCSESCVPEQWQIEEFKTLTPLQLVLYQTKEGLAQHWVDPTLKFGEQEEVACYLAANGIRWWTQRNHFCIPSVQVLNGGRRQPAMLRRTV